MVLVSTANDMSVEAIGWTLLQRLPLKPDNKKEFAREILGLGFSFDLDPQTKLLRITKVYQKSPAADAGLSAGMLVEKIGDASTAGKSVAECLVLLRAKGSPMVRLEVVNPERKTTNSVEVTRRKFYTIS